MAKKKLFDEHGNEVKGKLKKPFYKKVWFWVVVVIFVGVFGSMGGEEEVAETNAEKPQTETAAVESESSVVEESSEPEQDDVSQEYKNALSKADSYANGMSMSQIGVYNQLTSENGEGFPPEAAQYAIDNVESDWNLNALNKAKSYYEDQSMSIDGVYDQLISEYGEQFTAEQAQYAIDNLE